MGDYIFFFALVLVFLAALLRADFVLTLIYLLIGVFITGRWWSQRALNSVTARRVMPERAFLGEKIPVRLELENKSLLPVVWLQLHESIPVELRIPAGSFRRVVSLGGKSREEFKYGLEGRKRGYYAVGPLKLDSGDIFGVSGRLQRTSAPDHLIVYPKIIPLTKVKIPSHSPLGTLRHSQPVFEDPTRIQGKRDYVAGDSLRRVDWKSTAATGRLQVKLYEPSIALETAIFLDLDANAYDAYTRFSATELGIVTAASLAGYVVGLRQSVGLATNGMDPLLAGEEGDIIQHCPQPIPPRRGRGHLMRLLDVLARVQVEETYPFVYMLRREIVRLPWGATLILITPRLDDDLFDGLFQAQRAGLNAVLIACGPVPGFEQIRRRATFFGFPIYHFLAERDLDIWRQ